jgi:hypothetical protein
MARGKLAQLMSEAKTPEQTEDVTRARMDLETCLGNIFYTKDVKERRDIVKKIDALIVARLKDARSN